ncbi:MAG: arabinan endo-1,5-alpha-L-arabinosidase, partial [Sedimentisphaerales bacterium]|nr:arabinan endo-1,5-alpha-L-arabinosidase [Sedimentisphaerales bacterium]
MKGSTNLRILVTGLILACCLLSYSAQAQQNVLKGCADPAIIQGADGVYYVFATGRGLPFYQSTDLIRWERIGRIFETSVPDWARQEVPGTRGIWAPDITFYQGKYWLYYSVSTFGSQRSCIGLATNVTLNPDDPRYKWEDQGKVVESAPEKTNFNAIDPAAFTDQKGIRWLTWGSFWDGIKMTQLDPKTGKPLPDNKKI